MAVIGKIRQRSGLVITLIGISILAFILTDMLSGGNSLFGGNQEQVVGKINGRKIQYAEFEEKYKVIEQNAQAQYGRLTPELQDIVRDQIWQSYFRDYVLQEEYEKMHINVSAEELTWVEFLAPQPHPMIINTFTNPQTGQVSPDFATPTGQLDMGKVLERRKQLPADQEEQWVEGIDKPIIEDIENKKYFSYVSKGNFVTSLEAKDEYLAANSNVKGQIVKLDYISIADSTVNVTDAELREYLQKHEEDFQLEPSRKLEYVVFDINPTGKDSSDAFEWIVEKTKKFRETKNDSAFIVNNGGFYDTNFVRRGTFLEALEDSVFAAEPGKVFGPAFDQGGYVSLKVLETKEDTVTYYRASQILVRPEGATREDTTSARKKASEILTGLKNGDDFAAAVKEHSTDPNTNGNEGDFGWISKQQAQIPEKLIDQIAKTPVGGYTIVTTTQGVHIVKVTHKPSNTMVRVGQVEREIEPSSETFSNIVSRANEFAGSVSTEEQFNKGIEDRGLSKRFAESVRQKDRVLSGIRDARQIVRWAYADEREEGDISEPFEAANTTKLIVARLVTISKEGTATVEDVKAKLTDLVRNEKKAEILRKEFEDAMANANSLQAIAEKAKTNVLSLPYQQFNTTSVTSIGPAPTLLGYLYGSEANKIVGPIKDKNGVYVFKLEAKEIATPPEDLSQTKEQMLSTIVGASDVKANDALKEVAEIKDYRYKFY